MPREPGDISECGSKAIDDRWHTDLSLALFALCADAAWDTFCGRMPHMHDGSVYEQTLEVFP